MNRKFKVLRQPYGEPGTSLLESDIENKDAIPMLIQRGALEEVIEPEVEATPQEQPSEAPTPQGLDVTQLRAELSTDASLVQSASEAAKEIANMATSSSPTDVARKADDLGAIAKELGDRSSKISGFSEAMTQVPNAPEEQSSAVATDSQVKVSEPVASEAPTPASVLDGLAKLSNAVQEAGVVTEELKNQVQEATSVSEANAPTEETPTAPAEGTAPDSAETPTA